MGQKPKVRKGASKAESKGRSERERLKGKAQRERFIEAARAVGMDESGKEFEQALSVIVKRKQSPPK
jgi:hypothetical protein